MGFVPNRTIILSEEDKREVEKITLKGIST
jgi:hypothetical protein